MRGDKKSSRPVQAPTPIDLAAVPRQFDPVRVFRVECGSEAKREAGAMLLERSAKTGAAPATVNGE